MARAVLVQIVLREPLRSRLSTEPEEKSSSRLLTCWKPKIASETAMVALAAANAPSSRPPSGAARKPSATQTVTATAMAAIPPRESDRRPASATTASERHNR